MASVIESVRALLVADATVSGLVGAKVHAMIAPQREQAPFVVIRTVTAAPINTLTGAPAELLRNTRLQIDSFAADYKSAIALADAVEAVVAALQSPELSAMRIDGRDLYEDETQLTNVSRDYSVWA